MSLLGGGLISGLFDRVGNNRKNNENDVAAVRSTLGKLNYRTDEDKAEGIFTRSLDGAIKKFQKDEGLIQDGWLEPNGPTEKALGKRLAQNNAMNDGDIPVITVTPMSKKKPGRTIDPAIDDDRIIGFLEDDEKNIQHPYLDSKGNITIGIGKLVPDLESMRKLPLYYVDGDHKRAATQAEVDAGYKALHDMGNKGNYIAEHYKTKTNLRLDPEDAKEIARKHLQDDYKNLKNKFPDFDTFPEDIKFNNYGFINNIGAGNYKEENWPNLFDAIRKKDWARAAKESHRKGVSDERNQKTYDLFMRAMKKKD